MAAGFGKGRCYGQMQPAWQATRLLYARVILFAGNEAANRRAAHASNSGIALRRGAD
jgi:hypothetical protein